MLWYEIEKSQGVIKAIDISDKHSYLSVLFVCVLKSSSLSLHMVDQDLKLPLPKFLKILTGNGIVVSKAMAVAGKM